MIELLGYGVTFGDLSIMPVRIDADDTMCEVEFKTVNKINFERTIIRKGKHDNFVFSTSINNNPFTINLKTGVVKKVYSRKNKE